MARLRPVGQLLLPGKTQALDAFEPLAPEPAAVHVQEPEQAPLQVPLQAPLADYLLAFKALQEQAPEALALFREHPSLLGY